MRHYKNAFVLSEINYTLLREGTFFLGGGGGWEILVVFPNKALALPCILIKKLLTPHLYVTDKGATLPSLLHGMFHTD